MNPQLHSGHQDLQPHSLADRQNLGPRATQTAPKRAHRIPTLAQRLDRKEAAEADRRRKEQKYEDFREDGETIHTDETEESRYDD